MKQKDEKENEGTKKIPISEKTRSELLRYYTSQQTSQGARLIGFAIVLFTLTQLVQRSHEQPLSSVFSNLPLLLNLSEIGLILVEMFKFGVLLFSIAILIFWVIRTIFRFAVFAYFAQRLIELDVVEVSAQTKEPECSAVHGAVANLVAKEKVYFTVPLVWFFARGENSQNWKGLLFSAILAVLVSLILLWFLW